MASTLTAKERAHLKARAHALEPVVQTGGAGITDAVVKIAKTSPDEVHIVFQDVEKTHWGWNGKLASE